MKCPNCGTEISDGKLYCPNCGLKVSDGGNATMVYGPSSETQTETTQFIFDDLAGQTEKQINLRDLVADDWEHPDGADGALNTPAKRVDDIDLAATTIIPPKKNYEKILGRFLMIGVTVVLAGVLVMSLLNMNKGFELYAVIPENQEYTAKQVSSIYNSKKEVIGRIDDEETVMLVESGLDENGDVWGIMEGGSYILISSGSTYYLVQSAKTADSTGQTTAGNSNESQSESQPVSQQQESEPALQAVNPSQPQASESYIVKEQYVPYVLTSRQKTNYSGAAVAQSILDTHFYNIPQADIARDLGIEQAGVTDYRKLASYISDHSNHTYTPVLFDPNDVTKTEMSTCLSRLVQTLDDWYLPVVNFSPAGFINQSEDMYVIVCGYSVDSNGDYRFKLYLPHSEPVEIEVSDDELLNRMLAPKYFCYLY